MIDVVMKAVGKNRHRATTLVSIATNRVRAKVIVEGRGVPTHLLRRRQLHLLRRRQLHLLRRRQLLLEIGVQARGI